MKKLNLILIIICIGFICMTPLYSAINKTAQTGLQFLKIDMGARAAAMGGSYLMVGEDASAIFYNRAGLARMENKYSFFATQTNWIADINYIAGSLAANFQNIGTFGLSYVAADYGDDIVGTRYDATTEQGYILTGNLDVGAYGIGLTYAKSLTNKFSIGGQIKYVYQHLGDNQLSAGNTVKNEVSGVAYDFGTIFYPGFKSFRFGMAIRNFSPEFKYVEEGFELPLTFIIGFAMDVLDIMGEHQNNLLISLDATHPRDYSERIHLGAEYLFMDMISLRGGYKFNYDTEGLSAGVGLQKEIGTMKVDVGYSYSEFEYFDAVNRISFGFSF